MSRRCLPTRVVWIAGLNALLLVPRVLPQATVQGLTRELQPLEETTEIRLTRFADFSDEPVVRVGMELEPGDLLASVAEGVDLELQCSGGSVLRFTGAYRVLVDVPDEGIDCAVNFLSGTVDVLTDQPTEVQAGGVVLGSEGTQYTVELSRQDQQPDVSCQVYDGSVAWRYWRNQKVEKLSAGRYVRVVEQEARVAEIDSRQVLNAARRYARFDVARARASGQQITDEEAAVQELSRVHEKVLVQPRDTELRVDLAKTLLRYSLANEASYNLRAVGVESEEQMELHKIDTQKLRSGSDPRLSPSTVPRSFVPSMAAERDPWTLVQQKRYQEAIDFGTGKVRGGSATSRDYYALALAYRELKGRTSRDAASSAERALRLTEKDGLLDEDEIRRCRSLAKGY